MLFCFQAEALIIAYSREYGIINLSSALYPGSPLGVVWPAQRFYVHHCDSNNILGIYYKLYTKFLYRTLSILIFPARKRKGCDLTSK